LIGDDVPGTMIDLKLKRENKIVEVVLIRACTADIADEKEMFNML